MRRAWLVPTLAALALAASGCGDPQNGGDIVPSGGTSGTTPATVPNGPGTPTTDTGAGTTSTSSTATGAAPAPGNNDAPLSQDQQQGTTTTSP